MGVIEETRQVLQDFIAPELRSIDARLSALEKQLGIFEARIDRNHDDLTSRLAATEARSDRNYVDLNSKISSLEARMASNHAELMNALITKQQIHELELRLAAIEASHKSAA